MRRSNVQPTSPVSLTRSLHIGAVAVDISRDNFGRNAEHVCLHPGCRRISSSSVIKQAVLAGLLTLLIALLLSACASSGDGSTTTESGSSSTAAVPGEKASDDNRYAPGPMGSSSVRW